MRYTFSIESCRVHYFFTTLAQAEQNCPATNALTFTPTNKNIVHSQGKITGGINGTSFTSGFVTQPQSMSANGIVENATFRQAEGNYGYISGSQITCLYSYPNFINNNAYLILQGRVAE